ncbi:MAG TPA: glycosyltransferase family 4 protein [Candidatus Paceibacterota bacterium]|nr:glycosyltransferase family 4 protein [Candidatus Paceibacterota bacterium]
MKICWFGIYNPDFSRNQIYIRGLRVNDVTVLECADRSPGLRKYLRLWQKHRALQGNYDALVVGYPGHLVVPFAKLLSRKPVVADLLGSLADAEQHSHMPSRIRLLKSRIADWCAVHFADLVLLESEAQKRYFEERFGPSGKYRVLYTGADDSVFYCDSSSSGTPRTVLFRGRLTPECGILHILEAARLLKNEHNIRFRVLGSGPLLAVAQAYIQTHALENVVLVTEYLSGEALRTHICDASLALGQFEHNPRLSRTIPHKAFEAFAMGIPYLTGNGEAVCEIVQERETGFLVPLGDPAQLAEKIRSLMHEDHIRLSVAAKSRQLFAEQFAPAVLARKLVSLLAELT